MDEDCADTERGLEIQLAERKELIATKPKFNSARTGKTRNVPITIINTDPDRRNIPPPFATSSLDESPKSEAPSGATSFMTES